MTPEMMDNLIVLPALALLRLNGGPEITQRAQHMLGAIALQESGLDHRRQVGGPARGFWQFERIGVLDVVQRRATLLRACCEELVIPFDTDAIFEAITFNDALACIVARLTLHLDRAALPGQQQEDVAWNYYIRNWRPGKPHRSRWPRCWSAAREAVYGPNGNPAA